MAGHMRLRWVPRRLFSLSLTDRLGQFVATTAMSANVNAAFCICICLLQRIGCTNKVWQLLLEYQIQCTTFVCVSAVKD